MLKKMSFIFIFALLFGQNIFAIDLRTSTTVPVLYVGKINHDGKFSGWKKEINLSKDDLSLAFHIHSYANGGEVVKLKNVLSDPTNQLYSKGSEYYFQASIDADNTDPIAGSVKVKMDNDIFLTYKKYSWAIKLMGNNPEKNEHFYKLPYSQNPENVFKQGVSLGNLEEDHRSNLLVYFRVQTNLNLAPITINPDSPYHRPGVIKKTPVNGKCGSIQNGCSRGGFKDDDDTDEYFVWFCLGKDGGTTSQCKLEKPKKPINAICGRTLNTCKVGEFKELKDDDYYKKWKCLGRDDGKDAGCFIEKMCGCSKVEDVEKKYILLEKKCSLDAKHKFFYTEKEKEGILECPSYKKEKKSTLLSWPVFGFLFLIIIILLVRLVVLKKAYEG